MTGDDAGSAVLHLALRLLAAREHSRLELARKLAARGFGEAAIGPVLERLAAEGALDESRLAELYVAERVRKGYGPMRIRRELRDKGLSDADVAPHLAAMADDWPARLAEVHDRKFGPLDAGADRPNRAELARRARFLESRGFSPETIRRFLHWND